MPKNIVLLSDGTGNSAAKLFKTNVWRLYESLDLRDPAVQVACYDDGVGTSKFQPLALAGGALGFGLKRNVLRLYRFLCEQYEPGDRIYAFGFSRGAFTIRVLVALVADQGIIKVRPERYRTAAAAVRPAVAVMPAGAGVSVAEAPAAVAELPAVTSSALRRLSRRAYQRFRHNFDQSAPIVALSRAARDRFFRMRDVQRGRTPYDPARNHPIGAGDIVFVGLWDTVDAYGLPIDELTRGVDRWIWPLSFPELRLSDKVEKACHALSLDDERHTFHPVLWDESAEPAACAHLDDERVSQVWFAGVHANVGGGYPNDALSAVSLEWMAVEARKKQLRFLREPLEHATEKRDPLGTVYDSRRGLAATYRYNPRRVEYLTNGQVHERAFRRGRWPSPEPTVAIPRPKIHESVFTRIAAAPDFYAPIGLPRDYAVVKANGSIVAGDANPIETPAMSAARTRAQEVVWDLVWWRRVCYFAGIAVAAGMLLWPWRPAAPVPAGGLADSLVVTWLGGLLPDLAAPWVDYYAAARWELTAWLLALSVPVAAGQRLRKRIGDRMHQIWRHVMAATGEARVPLPEPGGWLFRARQHRYYHGVWAVFRRIVLPNVFGLLILGALIAAAAGTLVWLAGRAI